MTRTSSARLFAAGGSLATQPANQDADVFRLALPDDLVTALTDRRFILRKPLLHQGLLIPEVADHYCRAVGDLPGAEDVRSTAQALLVNPDGEGLLVLETGTLLDACELSQALTLLTAVLSMVSRPLRAFAQWPLWKPLGTNLSIDPMRATGTGYNPLHLDIVNSTRPPDHSVLLCVRPDPLGGGHSLVSQVRRALARLDHDDVALLRDPAYKDGAFFALSGVGEEWNPFPIVDDLPPRDGFVRFTGKMLSGADSDAPHTVAARKLPLHGPASRKPLPHPHRQPAPRPRHRPRADREKGRPAMSDRPFPHDARTAASIAAEAVRALNHLTAPHNGYPGLQCPDDLYATLGELTTLARRLDQTLAQLSGWAANAARQGHVAVATSGGDSDQTPTTTVAALEDSLDRATEHLRTAANDINTAWSLAGHIVVAGDGPVSPGPPHQHSCQLDLGDLL